MFTSTWSRKEILDYIGKEYARCLYLYIDFCVYADNGNSSISAYVDRAADGSVQAVALSYYTSLHIFSKNEQYYSDGLLELVKRHEPATIFAVASIMRILAEHLPSYTYSEGTVGVIRERSGVEIREQVVRLDESMLPAVADLLIDGQNYTDRYGSKRTFLTQLTERYRYGMGRHMAILGEDGAIIAHAATYAEFESIAVASGIYTLPAYRQHGLALQTYAALCNELIAEGKEVFAYFWAEHTADMHHKIGFTDICQWGELKKK